MILELDMWKVQVFHTMRLMFWENLWKTCAPRCPCDTGCEHCQRAEFQDVSVRICSLMQLGFPPIPWL